MTKIYLANDPAEKARAAQTMRIRDLNDAARNALANTEPTALYATRNLVITPGVHHHGWGFIMRALAAVHDFSDFTPDNDPYGEHDFGAFTLDDVRLNWKIDCYDRALEYGSEDPSNPAKTQRVLTIMLAEEY